MTTIISVVLGFKCGCLLTRLVVFFSFVKSLSISLPPTSFVFNIRKLDLFFGCKYSNPFSAMTSMLVVHNLVNEIFLYTYSSVVIG